MTDRSTPTQRSEAVYRARPDGSQLLRLRDPLGSYPTRVTAWLEHWAALTPDRPLLARRRGEGWESVS